MAERVLITGGSRGIGAAIAKDLAAAGLAVVINYRSDESSAEAVCAAIRDAGGEARALRFDVGDREATRAALEAEMAEHEAFWGVVLSAGVTADAPLAAMGGDDWDRVVRTNLDGFYNVMRPLVMPMVRLRRGGRVVALSSVTGMTGNRGQTNYAATKAGLVAAARSLSLELASRKITVNSVAPGYIETDMVAELPLEEIQKSIPMKRVGRPEEIAAVVRFLFSEGATYLTGQVIGVNGGLA